MRAIFDQVNLSLDRRQVLHRIGYDDGCEPPVRMVSLVDEYLEQAPSLIEPSYSYAIRDIEWARDPITFVEDSIVFKGSVITQMLERCSKVAVFALTIGKYLEGTAHQLARDGLILQATVLDAIGSDAVEKLADSAQGTIREIARAKGLVISRRFSPGYCDWDIGQQRMLFWALSGDTVGIHLTGRCLMIPQKSISGIIGIGSYNSNVENYNPCNTCKKQDCSGRR